MTTIRPPVFLSAASHNSSGDQGSTRVNDILHQFPFSLPYSGTVDRGGGKIYYQGTYGDFWSAGSDSATLARALAYNTTYTNPELSAPKTNGFTVRCDQGSTRVNDILHQFPFSLPYSGHVNRASGATVDQGTAGNWWSQGANSNTNARTLYIYGNYTNPENSNYKTDGWSVRCVVYDIGLKPKAPLFLKAIKADFTKCVRGGKHIFTFF